MDNRVIRNSSTTTPSCFFSNLKQKPVCLPKKTFWEKEFKCSDTVPNHFINKLIVMLYIACKFRNSMMWDLTLLKQITNVVKTKKHSKKMRLTLKTIIFKKKNFLLPVVNNCYNENKICKKCNRT